ncbi:hypothetical protein BO221_25735 [Archangium sp. Cb G35]|uniref:hypothetical protein n=1 Tax=Archangium sp. Cb G35 TaxID=1920190 RepID=UPI000937579F|nr:hypothetical protein [Archangium sp. Cb G35]OJT22135.1 hypothetical protein BO221_25735 [Archangium sp. Cb G35]
MEANRLTSRWNRLRAALFAMVLLGGAVAGHEASASSFTLFESGQVRPLALSPNGGFLYAVNTPDNRLEIFKVTAGALSHVSSVPVGLEPVAVAARADGEVWVVNHLSDSVSIVRHNTYGRAGTVVRTLLVGDEPRDIVFAGPTKSRAFITAAHRGQNVPFDPQFTTPGVGRADVWVFDSNNLGASLGGNPLKIITLFSDTPRALAVTPDGSRVYAAAFHSGNRSTVVHEILVPNGGETDGGVPGPNVNAEGKPAPESSVLVHFNGTDWVDSLGRPWTDKVKFSLPDKDVFVIDANANPPAQLAGTAGFYTGVGTILFNMAVNPVNGKVYVSNTEARNDLRFEGPGTLAGETLRGHLHESRISVLSSTGVAPRHLNKHINYAACCAALPNAENDKSLAQPLGMAVSSNGTTLYVAAFGSSKIGVYSTAALEADTFVPSTTNQISVSGGGPTGMVLDESSGRMYVLTRFDNGISVINTTTRQEIAHLKMHNPEPASVVAGRPFLYDAKNSSSHGDSSCASCHIFGDFDSLVWNLGNPDALYKVNPNPIVPVPPEFGNDPTFGQDPNFHPIKGPFSTQSLRGMSNHGPMHWRGDRTGGYTAPNAQPDSGAFNEAEAFKQFNPAFVDLLGRNAQLSAAEMQQFTGFMLQVRYPPNPVRNLDNSLTAAQQRGRDFYFNTTSFFHGSCNSCHTLDPNANPGEGPVGKGFFGTDGRPSFVATALFPKTPQLRNMYQKVGMFGVGYDFGFTPADGFMGDQIRGFGFNSDGSIDTLFRFNSGFDFHPIFNSVGIPEGPEGYQAKLDMEQFLLAFDTNLAPIVGQQVTLTLGNASVVAPRISLLVARANAGECDLVAKGRIALIEVGFFYQGGHFKPDRQLKLQMTDTVLRQQVSTADSALTFTCTPPGSGLRLGIDRDLDGFLDGDERAAGSNPADPLSTP